MQKGKTISFQALNWTQRTELKDKVDGALDADGEVYRCKFSPLFNEQHISQRNTTYINVGPKEPEASSSRKQAIVHTGQTSLLPTTHTSVKSDFEASVDKRFTNLGNSHKALKEEFGTLKTSVSDVSVKVSNIEVQNVTTQSKLDLLLERLPEPSSSSPKPPPPQTPPVTPTRGKKDKPGV